MNHMSTAKLRNHFHLLHDLRFYFKWIKLLPLADQCPLIFFPALQTVVRWILLTSIILGMPVVKVHLWQSELTIDQTVFVKVHTHTFLCTKTKKKSDKLVVVLYQMRFKQTSIT